MSTNTKTQETQKSRLDRILDAIERGGNALPHTAMNAMIVIIQMGEVFRRTRLTNADSRPERKPSKKHFFQDKKKEFW